MALRRAQTTLLAAVVAVGLLLVTAPSAPAKYPVSYDFTQGPIAQSANPGAPPPGANDWSCRPTRRHPRPVVLVHGLLANQTVNWQTYSPLLANHGYCVFSLTYGRKAEAEYPGYEPGGLRRIQSSARELRRFVKVVRKRTRAKRVDIVGHSEGSLMPAWYVKFLGGHRVVRRYVGITTIWHGTNALGVATLQDLGRDFGLSDAAAQRVSENCEACPQVVAGSKFMTKLRRAKKLRRGRKVIRVPRGRFTVPGVKYTSIVTRNDELVVPYTSGIEHAPNMRNLVVQEQCTLDQADHVSMAADPVVAQDILNALDPRHAAPVPCTAVVPAVGAPAYTGPPR